MAIQVKEDQLVAQENRKYFVAVLAVACAERLGAGDEALASVRLAAESDAISHESPLSQGCLEAARIAADLQFPPLLALEEELGMVRSKLAEHNVAQEIIESILAVWRVIQPIFPPR